MRVHLIYAHPASTSFTAAVHDRILSGLRTQAHQIDELDLYGAHFNPVLSLAEYTVYVKPGDNLTGIEDYVERLRAAEAPGTVLPDVVVRNVSDSQGMVRSDLGAGCCLPSSRD